MGYFVLFLSLGIVGGLWSRSWNMSGKTALALVAVPYVAWYLAGCSP
jgi:hypothetical protein